MTDWKTDLTPADLCCGYSEQKQEQIEKLQQENRLLLDMLKRLEFLCGDFGFREGYCPACKGFKKHKEDCELGNLLKEVEG